MNFKLAKQLFFVSSFSTLIEHCCRGPDAEESLFYDYPRVVQYILEINLIKRQKL